MQIFNFKMRGMYGNFQFNLFAFVLNKKIIGVVEKTFDVNNLFLNFSL